MLKYFIRGTWHVPPKHAGIKAKYKPKIIEIIMLITIFHFVGAMDSLNPI